jgi:hypothetical protein
MELLIGEWISVVSTSYIIYSTHDFGDDGVPRSIGVIFVRADEFEHLLEWGAFFFPAGKTSLFNL